MNYEGHINLKTNMKTIMKTSTAGLLLLLMSAQWAFAQNDAVEQEIADLSTAKWQWMADKNVYELAALFHDRSRFVHMSGTWGKDEEIDIIRSGRIHYKQADVHDVVIETFGDTVILWNRITLLAEVRGNEVSNEFTVTEIYQKLDDDWKLLDLTFSSVRDTHSIEH